jgi:hypothetical protein
VKVKTNSPVLEQHSEGYLAQSRQPPLFKSLRMLQLTVFQAQSGVNQPQHIFSLNPHIGAVPPAVESRLVVRLDDVAVGQAQRRVPSSWNERCQTEALKGPELSEEHPSGA